MPRETSTHRPVESFAIQNCSTAHTRCEGTKMPPRTQTASTPRAIARARVRDHDVCLSARVVARVIAKPATAKVTLNASHGSLIVEASSIGTYPPPSLTAKQTATANTATTSAVVIRSVAGDTSARRARRASRKATTTPVRTMPILHGRWWLASTRQSPTRHRIDAVVGSVHATASTAVALRRLTTAASTWRFCSERRSAAAGSMLILDHSTPSCCLRLSASGAGVRAAISSSVAD